MKKSILLLLLAGIVIFCSDCSKKKEGICYCKYLSGDKREFDMRTLPRAEALDSCNILNGNAKAFAGSCKLKD